MIDWHSHILPAMDDGCRNLSESILLLKMHVAQDIDTVVATPHFFANNESVESFLARRQNAYDSLKAELFDGAPEILLGAEVKYYSGISHMENLKKLTIEKTDLLLLEMPMSKWTEYTVRELVELSGLAGITVMLAHIDRYFNLQSGDVWERLYENGILMQVNADSFVELGRRRKAFSLIKKNMMHFLGSDCHNSKSRPPQLGKAVEVISKKFGNSFINQINNYGYSVINIE